MYCKICGQDTSGESNICACCGATLDSNKVVPLSNEELQKATFEEESVKQVQPRFPHVLRMICLVITLGLIIILLCLPGSQNIMIKNFYTPAALMKKVYSEGVKKVVSQAQFLDNDDVAENIAAEYTADIHMSEDVLSVLANVLDVQPEEIYGLSDIRILYDAASDGNVLTAKYSFQQDGNTILSMEQYADRNAMRQFFLFPELCDQPFVVNVTEGSEFIDIFADPDPLLRIDPEVLEKVSVYYTTMLVDGFENINKHSERVTYNGISQRLTVIQAAASTDELFMTLINILEDASDNPDILGVLYQMDEQSYEDYILSLNSQKDILQQFFQQSNAYSEIVLYTYLNRHNEIVGIKLEYVQNSIVYPVFSWITVMNGLRFATQMGISVDTRIQGTGAISQGLNGSFSVYQSDQFLCDVVIGDFQYSGKNISGSVKIIPSEEIVEHLMDEAGMYEVYLDTGRLPDFSTEISWNFNETHNGVTISFCSGYEQLANMLLFYEPKEPLPIVLPQSIIDKTDVLEFDQWKSEIDEESLHTLLNTLKNAGIS